MSCTISFFSQKVLSHSNYPEKKKDKLGTARRVIYVRREFLVSLPCNYVMFFPIYGTCFFSLDDTKCPSIISIINNFFNVQVRDSCAKDGLHIYYKHGEARNSP